MEDKTTKGGAREGAGRKTKADEEKTNQIFLTMIKEVKEVETDDEARIELAKQLFSFERGCMFISEHIFGKPKQVVDNNNFNVDASNLSTEEREKRIEELKSKLNDK